MIRASIDMRIPNQSTKRSRCVQSPRVEDSVYRLHDCKIFTKLDLRQGYHQLALYPSARQVATFSTPWGNYRLVFGAKSSQDDFDEAMFRIFGDIPHCLNQRDDILMRGRDETEYKTVLKTVLQRTRDHGTHSTERNVWKGMNRVLRTCFHQRWTKAITWQSKRNQRVRSAWEQRSCAKLSWDGRLPGQLLYELRLHSSTAVPANQKRNEISLGKTRKSSIHEDPREHLKWEDCGFLRPKQAHNPPYRGKL